MYPCIWDVFEMSIDSDSGKEKENSGFEEWWLFWVILVIPEAESTLEIQFMVIKGQYFQDVL